MNNGMELERSKEQKRLNQLRSKDDIELEIKFSIELDQKIDSILLCINDQRLELKSENIVNNNYNGNIILDKTEDMSSIIFILEGICNNLSVNYITGKVDLVLPNEEHIEFKIRKIISDNTFHFKKKIAILNNYKRGNVRMKRKIMINRRQGNIIENQEDVVVAPAEHDTVEMCLEMCSANALTKMDLGTPILCFESTLSKTDTDEEVILYSAITKKITEISENQKFGRFPNKHTSIADSDGIVTLFYGTNRKETENHEPNDYNHFYGNKRNFEILSNGIEKNVLTKGRCTVSIPKCHYQGEMERPKNKDSECKEEHIMISLLKPLENDVFYELLRNSINDTDNNSSALIFIHGYNTSFAGAARRAGQIAWDVDFKGITGFFSWPSFENISAYFADEDNAIASINALKEFIEDIVINTDVHNLHFIAHSMGNTVLTAALNKLSIKVKNKLKYSQIVLAAPDISKQDFAVNILPTFKNIGANRTLYVSNKDVALEVSKKFRKDLIRLGEAGGANIFIADGVETIDASNIEIKERFVLKILDSVPIHPIKWISSKLNAIHSHSYIFESNKLIKDLQSLLIDKLNAEERHLSSQPSEGKLKYWYFPK